MTFGDALRALRPNGMHRIPRDASHPTHDVRVVFQL
jgi:hypothetical protein